MPSIVANPYQVGGMIRDRKQFIGRERESAEILSRVATMQSVSVVGVSNALVVTRATTFSISMYNPSDRL